MGNKRTLSVPFQSRRSWVRIYLIERNVKIFLKLKASFFQCKMISSSIKKSCWQCLDSVGLLELSINLIKETWRWDLNPYFPIWNPELYHWTTETLRPSLPLKGSLSPILTASFSHKKTKLEEIWTPVPPYQILSSTIKPPGQQISRPIMNIEVRLSSSPTPYSRKKKRLRRLEFLSMMLRPHILPLNRQDTLCKGFYKKS